MTLISNTSMRLGGGQEKQCLPVVGFKIGPYEVLETRLSNVPLGYEPLAEFLVRAEAEAYYHERMKRGEAALLVREGQWWSIWAERNPMWNI